MLHVDEPTRRIRETVELVIDFDNKPMDLKGFQWVYNQVLKAATNDGVDLSYDNALMIEAHDGELVFSFEKKS